MGGDLKVEGPPTSKSKNPPRIYWRKLFWKASNKPLMVDIPGFFGKPSFLKNYFPF